MGKEVEGNSSHCSNGSNNFPSFIVYEKSVGEQYRWKTLDPSVFKWIRACIQSLNDYGTNSTSTLCTWRGYSHVVCTRWMRDWERIQPRDGAISSGTNTVRTNSWCLFPSEVILKLFWNCSGEIVKFYLLSLKWMLTYRATALPSHSWQTSHAEWMKCKKLTTIN